MGVLAAVEILFDLNFDFSQLPFVKGEEEEAEADVGLVKALELIAQGVKLELLELVAKVEEEVDVTGEDCCDGDDTDVDAVVTDDFLLSFAS